MGPSRSVVAFSVSPDSVSRSWLNNSSRPSPRANYFVLQLRSLVFPPCSFDVALIVIDRAARNKHFSAWNVSALTPTFAQQVMGKISVFIYTAIVRTI
jgi:hypothetical protein